MTSVTQKNGDFSVTAHGGDCKTLLAWNLPKATTKKLAGFTIQYDTADGQSFFIFNNLQFKQPALHAQDPTKPATSSINAPIHKFRWVHVPGSLNQGTEPFFGIYTYTVTPRYFDSNEHLLPIDRSLSASVPIQVGPFVKGKVALGFARGYVQSQAFVHQFGPDAKFRPDGKELLFNTALVAGTSPRTGKPFTFAQEYGWMGFTARTKIFEILDEVSKNKALKLSVFAYDLNEPDVMKALLTLAAEKRVRIILDNATLHHTADSKTTPEAKPVGHVDPRADTTRSYPQDKAMTHQVRPVHSFRPFHHTYRPFPHTYRPETHPVRPVHSYRPLTHRAHRLEVVPVVGGGTPDVDVPRVD